MDTDSGHTDTGWTGRSRCPADRQDMSTGDWQKLRGQVQGDPRLGGTCVRGTESQVDSGRGRVDDEQGTDRQRRRVRAAGDGAVPRHRGHTGTGSGTPGSRSQARRPGTGARGPAGRQDRRCRSWWTRCVQGRGGTCVRATPPSTRVCTAAPRPARARGRTGKSRQAGNGGRGCRGLSRGCLTTEPRPPLNRGHPTTELHPQPFVLPFETQSP